MTSSQSSKERSSTTKNPAPRVQSPFIHSADYSEILSSTRVLEAVSEGYAEGVSLYPAKGARHSENTHT